MDQNPLPPHTSASHKSQRSLNDLDLSPKRVTEARRAEILARKISLLLGSIMMDTGEPYGYPAIRDGAEKVGYFLSRTRWSLLRNGKEQKITDDALRAVASVFKVNANYLLEEDGPVPVQVEAKFEQLKVRNRAEVRRFAARALETVDPDAFRAIIRILDEGHLTPETPGNRPQDMGLPNTGRKASPGVIE